MPVTPARPTPNPRLVLAILGAILVTQGVFAGVEILGRPFVPDETLQLLLRAGFVVYAVLIAIFAVGAWRRMSWAWTAALGVPVLGLALGGLRLLAGESIEQLFLGLAIDGALLYYLMKPSIRALFQA
jgi:uncharacterized membrane protein (DUF2068 family)